MSPRTTMTEARAQSRPSRWRALAPSAPAALVASLVSMAACTPPRQPSDPAVLGRLAATTQLAFAYELTPVCALEVASFEEPPVDPAAWNKVGANELANEQLTVVDRGTNVDERGTTRLLRVRDSAGKTRWLRNAPAPNGAEVERRWSCAVDADLLASRVKAVTATSVRLVPNAPSCASLTPVLGDAADVTFDPYAVLGRRLVHTNGGLAAVVTLASADGEHVLTLSAADLDSCFAVTKRAATPRRSARASRRGWATPPRRPRAQRFPRYLQTAGLDDAACLSEGNGPTRHDECRCCAVRRLARRAERARPAVAAILSRARDRRGARLRRKARARGGARGDQRPGASGARQRRRRSARSARRSLASLVDARQAEGLASVTAIGSLRAADVSNGTTANATLDRRRVVSAAQARDDDAGSPAKEGPRKDRMRRTRPSPPSREGSKRRAPEPRRARRRGRGVSDASTGRRFRAAKARCPSRAT